MAHPKHRNWESEGHKVGESLNKEWGYLRIGINVFTKQFGHENISDVHILFHRDPKYPGQNRDPKSVKSLGILAKAYFTGPNTSIYDLRSPTRSLREVREYQDFGDVDSDRDIEAGGNAIIVEAGNYPHTRPKSFTPTSRFHVWLLGPLTLLDRSYGSLFFELVGPLRQDRSFRPLNLMSSSYSEGPLDFIPRIWKKAPDMEWDDYVVDAYNKRLQGVSTVPLPPGALRWEWHVETVAANVTSAAAIRKSG